MNILFRVGILTLFTSALFAQLQTPNLQGSEHVDATVITVTPFGPYPTKIKHGPNPFVLVVVNRSGVLDDTFSLVLKSSAEPPDSPSDPSAAVQPSAHSLLDLHSTHKKHRDHKLIEPLPGNYQLRFLSHPNWVVDIEISGN